MSSMIKVRMIGIFTHSLVEIINLICLMKRKELSRRMEELSHRECQRNFCMDQFKECIKSSLRCSFMVRKGCGLKINKSQVLQ
jgi:hypothetical protein